MPGPTFPVTLPPILIDTSGVGHTSRQSGSEVNPMLVIVGSDQYVVFANTTDSSIRIFKSIDDGSTWTLKDDADSPDQGGIDPHSLNVFYDGSAKIIYVSYLVTGVDRKLVSFDTNTDTYGASIVWGFSTTTFFERTAVLIRQLSGVFQLFYSDNSSGNINYITLTGSTPSGPTTLVNLSGSRVDVDCGIQDASGAIHISYGQDPGTRWYIRVSSGLAVTSGPTSFGANDGFRADVLITSAGQLVFAWTDFSTILVEISASLTTPSFTKYTVATNMTGGDFNYASLAEELTHGLRVFWAYVSSGDGIDEIDTSLFDGVSTWSAPVLFYDEITNPPANSDSHQFVHTGQVQQLATGTWLYITAMETVSPTGCTGFALRDPVPTPSQTLELTKLVVGGNNNASDFFLQATGNNNTISGNGHVGPSNVNPDTYILSETAFPNLIWANDNQTWANDNNSWTQNYVAGNWNCGNATMPTPNSVVVPSGQNVACTITNTANNAPPPPPPPPSQTGTCRTILHLWQLAAAPQVEITTDRASDWNNGGHEGNKFYQGLKLDADTFGKPKTLMIRDADTNTLHVLQPGVVNHAGRQVIPYSFQTPFTAHMVKDEPQDLVPWRKFGVTYVYELTPESVQTWITQFTAHGLKGYQHIARIEAAYASTANVTLTITSFDGTNPAPITLPPTGGAYQKLLLTLTANKGQLYRYAAQSIAPFQLYLEDWTVWLGIWGRSDAYTPYRSLGGSFGDKASI